MRLLIVQTATQVSERRGEGLGNLPAQLTRLIGREGALTELRALVWEHPVLTLCGAGGAGKTRLAVALGHALRPEFAGGAWWVDLSTTLEARLVAQAVASAILEEDVTSDPSAAAIARGLDEPSLMVLDNCEQVVDGCAELIVALLERSASLRVIATSRQPLGVPGEQVWRVGGLAVPGADGSAEARAGGAAASDGHDDAVSLFIERARLASNAFDADAPGVRENVRRICRWLDGMPLAIELAAARTTALPVAQLAERLERDPGLLRHPNRRAPERHRTLESMLDWSHRMLEPPEQRLFRRLGVFRGSFSLEAAERVCAGDELDVADVLDLLAVLIDRSLVQVVEPAGELRYRLLATVRQYAAAKLREEPEAAAVHVRHAEYFRALTVSARAELARPAQSSWLERLELEHDNLRAALEWLSDESIDEGAHMARLLWLCFWYQRGYYREARLRFERLLERAAEISPARRARILVSAGEVAFLQCDYVIAADHLTAALKLVDALGDRRAAAIALQRLGSIARERARYEEARDLHRRSLAIWEERGDGGGVAASRDYLGFVAWLSGDSETGEQECAAAVAAFRRAGDLRATAAALVNLGACALYRDEFDLARERLEEALSLARALGFKEAIAWSLHELAVTGRRSGQATVEVGRMLREALLVHRQLGDRWRIASVLEEIAGAVLLRSDLEQAVTVLAAAEALRERLGTPVPPAEAPDRAAALAHAARRLGKRAHEAAWAEGRASEFDQVIDLAVEALDATVAAATVAQDADPLLTPRELAVLELLSAGQTNREIAAALYISPSTAGVHVSNILRKLGAKRRVDAAGIAHRLGLLSTR